MAAEEGERNMGRSRTGSRTRLREIACIFFSGMFEVMVGWSDRLTADRDEWDRLTFEDVSNRAAGYYSHSLL